MLRLGRLFLKLIIVLSLLAFISAAAVYFSLAPKLPDTKTLKETHLQIPLRLYSAEGLLMAEFGEKRRIPVTYDEVPTALIHAFLAAEDDRFFEHPGVDYQGIMRAVYSLLTTGEKSQGGSTITMQVARNYYLSSEKTYLRKLNEIILSLEIEKVLSKEEILELYLNKIYLGNRAYGIGSAARTYYDKPLNELTLAQMAMIAGLPKAPSRYNPIANPERATIRRNYVLDRMLQVGYIDQQQHDEAVAEAVTAKYHGSKIEVFAPYASEMIRSKLMQQYGDDLYTLGLNVHTTIKAAHQTAANAALQDALLAYDRRHGYRGPVEQLSLPEKISEKWLNQQMEEFDSIGPLQPALVIANTNDEATIFIKKVGQHTLTLTSMQWARKQLGVNSLGPAPKTVTDVMQTGDIIYVERQSGDDWQLAQLPQVQGALVSVSPDDGAVTAINGGFDFYQSKFNRATQSRRQPGSGFKPFIYSAALEKGYTAASIINDAPVVFDAPGTEHDWRPENYSGQFFGATRLREALIHSRNLVSIRLLRAITPDYAVEYAKRFGFDDTMLHKNLSLALGSGSAAPWDMARAYSAIANGGFRVEPYLIKEIDDSAGNVLYQADPATACRRCDEAIISQLNNALDAEAGISTAETEEPELVTDLRLPPVEPDHLAQRIMTPQNNYLMNSMLRDVVRFGTGRQALSLGRHDLAGKTGTTNDQLDAWFNGFHPNLVAIAWVGFDTPSTLGRYETGGRAALPMWIEYMGKALKGVPEAPLDMPKDMVTVKINKDTGLLAAEGDPNAIYETFRKDHVPTLPSPAQQESNAPVIEDLF